MISNVRGHFDKFSGDVCHGVMVHVTDAATFRPVTTYLTLLAFARAQAPDDFAIRTSPYEFETTTPALDLLTGSAAAREALMSGASAESLIDLVTPVPALWADIVRDAEALVGQGPARA